MRQFARQTHCDLQKGIPTNEYPFFYVLALAGAAFADAGFIGSFGPGFMQKF